MEPLIDQLKVTITIELNGVKREVLIDGQRAEGMPRNPYVVESNGVECAAYVSLGPALSRAALQTAINIDTVARHYTPKGSKRDEPIQREQLNLAPALAPDTKGRAQ